MEKVILSGKPFFEYKDDGFMHYYLVQPDGYRMDFIARVAEIADNFGGAMAVNIYSSDTPKTLDEMVEGFLEKVYGTTDARYWSEGYYYSSYTNGAYDHSTCEVGGHNLLDVFQDAPFVLFEFLSK